jgi:23S rRNA (cytosine1962-C5)-methyltransferase
VLGGHPWIFDRAVQGDAGVKPGELVTVADRRGALAIAYADPGSPIAARVLSLDVSSEIDDGWIADCVRRAAAVRAADPLLAATDAFRVVHGENDMAPGLVVDVYAGTAVVVFDGKGAESFWLPHLDAIIEGCKRGGVHMDRVCRKGGEVLRGPPLDSTLLVEENDARFEVDLARGQKTGLFLDQRRNRLAVREISAGARVLNLFSYTGGFSIHAALGGAQRVTSVDVAAGAIEAAGRNVAHSGLDVSCHELVAEDAFAFLDRAAARGRRFDVVIVDPPSFAPSAKAKASALGAYRKLNAQALEVVDAGGTLVSCSCSSHVTDQDLIDAVGAAAATARRDVRITAVMGPASDHPVRPCFPEGRYLTCLIVAVS